MFKELGAIRCFYTCLKAFDLNIIHQTTSGVINIDSDLIHQIWELYPALIEFVFEYFKLLVFEYNLVAGDLHPFKKDEFFSHILQEIPINEEFQVLMHEG